MTINEITIMCITIAILLVAKGVLFSIYVEFNGTPPLALVLWICVMFICNDAKIPIIPIFSVWIYLFVFHIVWFFISWMHLRSGSNNGLDVGIDRSSLLGCFISFISFHLFILYYMIF